MQLSRTKCAPCGVFWPQSRPDTLFNKLRACHDGVFFQPFWTEDPLHEKLGDNEMAAVAARFGVVPDNMKYISVYPAYLVVRGPSTAVSKPHISEQPWWEGKLFPCGSGIEKGLRALSDVPQLPEKNEVRCRDFLPLKQKLAPLWLWTKGVHQLLLWVGCSRPSRKCHMHRGCGRDRRGRCDRPRDGRSRGSL